MASKELFYDNRPIVLLDPKAANRIDPRFAYTRNSTGTYVDYDGIIKTAPAGRPRIEYDFATKQVLGLLLEPASTNYFRYSQNLGEGRNLGVNYVTFTDFATGAPNGGGFLRMSNNGLPVNPLAVWPYQYGYTGAGVIGDKFVFSMYVRSHNGTQSLIQLSNPDAESTVFPVTQNWTRIVWNFTYGIQGGFTGFRFYRSSGIGSGASIDLAMGQIEKRNTPTSYIDVPTTGTVSRAADLLYVDSLNISSSGSAFCDSKALTTESGSTIISLSNTSGEKINLAMESRSELYNSLALTYSIKGTVKPTLPYPVPTTTRERNLVTWGTYNYQYSAKGSRYASSLSTTPGIPASINKLSIGHDAVDPTKAFHGYISSAYIFSGEIAPTVANALVRGNVVAVDSDTYTPTGPAGSLSLIINTQGSASDGNTLFSLPAASGANSNDIVVTWGDGTESALELAAAEVGAAGLNHTYSSPGIYPIWVSGSMRNIYFNNSAQAPDLLRITQWGTGSMFTAPNSMVNAFYGCSNLKITAGNTLPNTSGVTNWYRAFRGCSSLGPGFPSFNTSAATNLSDAWYGCSSLTSFPILSTGNVTTFAGAWYGCSGLTSFPQINTAAGTDYSNAWTGCTGLTSFPLLETGAATNFTSAWQGCTGLTSFPLINTTNVVTLALAWDGCTGLTTFPLINTASVTNFSATWRACTSLISFPLINTTSATTLANAWRYCYALTSIPLLNTPNNTSLDRVFEGCGALVSFPAWDTSKVTNMEAAWAGCSSFTSFPTITANLVATIRYAWQGCSGLTAFPALTFTAVINAAAAWKGCLSLTAFPSVAFPSVIGLATDTDFTGFFETWYNCTSLSSFPANVFNGSVATSFIRAFQNCALSAQSIENILVSIDSNSTSNGNLTLNGGTNASKSLWSTAANNAYNALISRGWTINFNA